MTEPEKQTSRITDQKALEQSGNTVEINFIPAEGDAAQTCEDFQELDIIVTNSEGERLRHINYVRCDDGTYQETDTDPGSPGNDPENPHIVSQNYVLGAAIAHAEDAGSFELSDNNATLLVDSNVVPESAELAVLINVCENNGVHLSALLKEVNNSSSEAPEIGEMQSEPMKPSQHIIGPMKPGI